MQRTEHHFRILYNSEHFSKIRTIDITARSVEMVTTSVDVSNRRFDILISSRPTAFIVSTIEKWTCPPQQW